MSAIDVYKKHCEMMAELDSILRVQAQEQEDFNSPSRFRIKSSWTQVNLLWDEAASDSTQLLMQALSHQIDKELKFLIERALINLVDKSAKLRQAAQDEAINFIKGS